MSKLIRGALLAALLCTLPRCGGTDATEETGAPSAGQSAGGTKAGDAGSQTGGSGGAGDVAHAGSVSAGEAGTSHVGGAAGSAGMAGAAGAVGLVGCGGVTCGPNEYCRAPCNGTSIGVGGTTGLPMPPPMPNCAPLPVACNGTPTCDCVCGPTLGFAPWCSTGSKPIPPGPAIQCGCA